MSYFKLSAILSALTLSFSAFAEAPTQAQLDLIRVTCIVSSVSYDDTNGVQNGDSVEFEVSDTLNLHYTINSQPAEILTGVPIEKVKVKKETLTFSGSLGSVFIGNKLSGKFTYNTIKRSGEIESSNRIWIPKVGADKADVKFEFHNCKKAK